MRLPGEAGGLGTIKTCRVRDVSVAMLQSAAPAQHEDRQPLDLVYVGAHEEEHVV
jgi:hypothetical protein